MWFYFDAIVTNVVVGMQMCKELGLFGSVNCSLKEDMANRVEQGTIQSAFDVAIWAAIALNQVDGLPRSILKYCYGCCVIV